jgi:hypothetical protein
MSTIPNSAMPHAGGTTSDSETGGNYQNAGDSDFSGESEGWNRSDLMERAREHKTGIALGVAAGAIAAAAIPFMLSRSSERSGSGSSRSRSSSGNKSGSKSKSRS